jgi:hypothetical protein
MFTTIRFVLVSLAFVLIAATTGDEPTVFRPTADFWPPAAKAARCISGTSPAGKNCRR